MTDHELMQLSEVVGLALKQRGAHIAILSNGSPAMLASAVKSMSST